MPGQERSFGGRSRGAPSAAEAAFAAGAETAGGAGHERDLPDEPAPTLSRHRVITRSPRTKASRCASEWIRFRMPRWLTMAL